MRLDHIFDESDALAEDLLSETDLPLIDDSPRIIISDVACSLSLEHWHAARYLLRVGLLPSALVVHRAQFESLTRCIWLTYAASDNQLEKLAGDLTIETEQTAKNMPQVADMLEQLLKTGPRPAYEALTRFKDHSWKALNSYAHAGIHPIRRHHDGYPTDIVENALRNANGLAVMSCMQAVVLSGEQPMQKAILEIGAKHSSCMPQLL